MNKLPKHLGGHQNKTHLDEGTLIFLKNNYKIKTMLDIGCGPGGMIELARSYGINAQGIDGDPLVERSDIVKNNITIHDYTKGPSPIDKTFDFVWSCEFVEHVYEEYLPNFMEDFAKGKYILMTFAPLGKKGHHHVNCNTQEYWIDVFDKYGFNFQPEITKSIRETISTMGSVKNDKKTGLPKYRKAFVREHGMFFIRR